jgi:hypothetical protein
VEAGLDLHALDELCVALHTAPEGFRRHSHDQGIGLAGHHVPDGDPDGPADLDEECLEAFI